MNNNIFQNNPKPFSNPVLIYGSSFGNYFQMLYKTGKYEEMIKFTSSKSVKSFGSKAILELYKKMNFGYTIKLKSKNDLDNGSIMLNYETIITATKGMLRMNVMVENDTTKIILQSINMDNPF
jgi:hypothetical protein